MNVFDKENTVFICISDDMKWCVDNLPNIVPCEQNIDYLEMFIYSNLDSYIIANSTFSWWAVFFGNADKNKRVIAPKEPWIRNCDTNSYIYEPDWEKI